MTVEKRPVIAITIGDPAGIGPEVVVKALSDETIYDICRPFVIGESAAVRAAIALTGKNLNLNPIDKVSDTIGKSALSIFWICTIWNGIKSKWAHFRRIAAGHQWSFWKRRCSWR